MHKIKYGLPILIIFFFFSCKIYQKDNTYNTNSVYHIVIEGGSLNIKIDSISSLDMLIPRLATEYKLYETNKGYWIGYNDLMFSIAIHSDDAVKPLLTFIDTTKSKKAKIAACYTLHLIGIECKIIGRTIEDFKNPYARRALLKLLYCEDLQEKVMELLIRDAWQSDVPTLMQILQSSKSDSWPIVNGLVRYNLPYCPINQPLTEDLKNLYINFPPYKTPNVGPYSSLFRKSFAPFLKRFSEKYSTQVYVEDTLFDYNFIWPLVNAYTDPITSLGLDGLLITTYLGEYCKIGNNFQYYIDNNQVHICSSMTGKFRWIEWWKNRSQSYKDSLQISKLKTFDPNKSVSSEKK